MNRFIIAFACAFLLAGPTLAHHIWIIPVTANGPKATAVFSDYLKPSDSESIKKVVHTRLWVREQNGNEELVEWTRNENSFSLEVPGKGVRMVGGACSYGVETFDHRLQKHGEPYLLKYYPKAILGKSVGSKPWNKLALEIVAVEMGDEIRLQVFFQGKPAPGAEMRVQAPDQERASLTTNGNGEITIAVKKPGLHGLQTRFIEKKAGEQDGKKYGEIRHHATLVLHLQTVDKANRK